jgi:DNA gyrase/topoisomerase IV subunit A
VVQSNDDLTVISAAGVVLRTPVKAIARSGRAARGVVLMTLPESDLVASLARIAGSVTEES